MQTPVFSNSSSELTVDRERRLHVRGGLHVEEEVLAEHGGSFREVAESLQRGLRVLVEPQVGRLHRDLGVEPALSDQVEEPPVVLDDLLGVGRAADALAEERERRRDAVLRETGRRVEAVLHPLAGHESGDGRADESIPGKVLAQPAVARGQEECVARRVHGRIASISRPARRPVSIAPSM